MDPSLYSCVEKSKSGVSLTFLRRSKGKQFVAKKEKNKYYTTNILKDWNVIKISENQIRLHKIT